MARLWWEGLPDSSWNSWASGFALTPQGLTPTWREAPEGQADSKNLMGQLLLVLFVFFFLLLFNIITFRFFSIFFTIISTLNKSCMNSTENFFYSERSRASCQLDVLLLPNFSV